MVFRSIRSRIAVATLVLIATAMAGLAWYVLSFVRESYLVNLEGRLAADARLIADVAHPVFVDGNADGADDLADRYGRIMQARVTLIDVTGVVLGDSEADVETMLNHLQRPEIVQARNSGIGIGQRFSNTLAYDALYVAVPVSSGADSQGYVRLAVPLRAIDQKVRALRGSILGATGLIMAIALALGLVVAEKTARPIRELTGVVQRVARGDLSPRLMARSRDEVGMLAQSFTEMTDTLRSTIEDLSRERSEAAAILDHMADGIVITDHEGHIQLINPAAQRILATTEADSLGRSLPQIAREDGIILAMRACLNEQRDQDELVDLSRSNLLLHVVATPIMTGSAGSGCLMVLQDLGQIRRLESIRRDFVSNVSHELRTPLASLRALVDTLRGGALDDPPAAAHFLERMDQEIDDLTHMVGELLELSRIESGQAPIRLAPVAVADVVEPAVERLRTQAERGQLTLDCQLPPDLYVLADQEQLHQVVTNLVQNAIKFTPPGGHVSVTAQRDGERVIVTVRDSGVGIPETVLPRIFERFYKADPARASRGTGLGLAIAKHIVQAHGGEVWVTSVEGQGSSFSFSVFVAPERPFLAPIEHRI